MRFRTAIFLAALLSQPALTFAAIKQRERNIQQEAEAALRERNPAAALRALDELIKTQPANAAARFWRGRLLAEQREFDKALADLEVAIKLNPGNADAFAYRGYVHQKRSEPDEAMADFNRALRGEPNNEFAL